MGIITQESLASTLVKTMLQEIYDEYVRDVLIPDKPQTFDEYVWERREMFGVSVYAVIALGNMYGDLDEAISEVM